MTGRFLLGVVNLGVLAGWFGVLSPGSAQAQYATYPGGYGAYPGSAPVRSGWSVQVGVGAPTLSPSYGFVGGGGGYATGGYVSGGYTPGCVGPGYGSPRYPSPAARQGYREGELYWETGIAPNRPLSPAEARGFAAGERRAASTPWQLDPARQQGYREGQLYWETGIAPSRPLTPAEAQGFRAGENRAAAGYGYGYPY